jgi:large subunit ribosomal protein L4
MDAQQVTVQEEDLETLPAGDNDDNYAEQDLTWQPPAVQYVVPLPERLHVPIYTVGKEQVGTIWLHDRVFGHDQVRVDLIKRAVDYIRAKIRGRRMALTKNIGRITGSTRKLRQQKGLGRARVGHGRPPQFRGGAVAHGPSNQTDYGRTKLNKKVRKLALQHVLSQKLQEGNLIVWDTLARMTSHKTKEVAQLLNQWKIGGIPDRSDNVSALILDEYKGDGNTAIESFHGVPVPFFLAVSNLPRVSVGNLGQHGNVYDILRHTKLVITLDALAQLERNLKAH